MNFRRRAPRAKSRSNMSEINYMDSGRIMLVWSNLSLQHFFFEKDMYIKKVLKFTLLNLANGFIVIFQRTSFFVVGH